MFIIAHSRSSRAAAEDLAARLIGRGATRLVNLVGDDAYELAQEWGLLQEQRGIALLVAEGDPPRLVQSHAEPLEWIEWDAEWTAREAYLVFVPPTAEQPG